MQQGWNCAECFTEKTRPIAAEFFWAGFLKAMLRKLLTGKDRERTRDIYWRLLKNIFTRSTQKANPSKE
jgi:hypothetical protein